MKSWQHLCTALAGCGALFVAIPAMADVKDGVDAWSRGDFSSAVRAWRGPATKGDPDAQFNLAQAYKLGRGVQRDLKKAEQLFEQAAAHGHLQAADNFGLLLFQRGERARAMPFIHAASQRGDPRAHYVLGLAHFNGDGVAKDWERAYALVSLAQQSGLPQAAGALSQMDQYIPLEQRQRSVLLAGEIAANAVATRQRQIAAADLGVTGPGSKAPANGSLKPFRASTKAATAGVSSPAAAGADYTRGSVPP
ncbi:MAG: sel1 repeat family protein, partial [Sphingomonadaceae bacterium]|nr:sel1 repeat family protein [Sphingomonadaceae bacterium]